MPTSFSVEARVLEAIMAFAVKPNEPRHPILHDVLVEVTPDCVRLVATDTHTLGLLHLTPISGFGVEVQCEAPTTIVLPVNAVRPLLRDGKRPVHVTIDGQQVEVRAPGGALTVAANPPDEYPAYDRVVPAATTAALPRIAVDLELVEKFRIFARKIGYPAQLDLGFHGSLGPMSVRIRGLTSFYGVLMPMNIAFESAHPAWLRPPTAVTAERVVLLHDASGEAALSGVDQHGCTWSQFTVDPLAGQAPGMCAFCGETLTSGWVCGDGGDEVCDDHVRFAADLADGGASGVAATSA